MNHSRRFLIVEYDTDRANTWVPHRSACADLNICSSAGYTAVRLGTRSSNLSTSTDLRGVDGKQLSFESSNRRPARRSRRRNGRDALQGTYVVSVVSVVSVVAVAVVVKDRGHFHVTGEADYRGASNM